MRTTSIRHIVMALLLMPSIILSAQTVDEKKKEINKIKKSSQYIYAETTAATEQEAKELAEEILYQEINEWVASQKKLRQSSDILISDRKELWATVSLPRGNMYRSFIYVKKSDIQSADNTEIISNNNYDNLTSTVEQMKSQAANAYPETVTKIATCQEYTEMANMIKEMEAQGKIEHYARYASLTKPENYYLAIYDKTGKVKAVLSPGKERTNVVTGQADAVTNYAGCGAIGFTVK